MKIRQLRQRADRASMEAARSARRALHRHADNSSRMLSVLVSSPKGLLLAFGIGAATGFLTADRSASASTKSKAWDDGREWLSPTVDASNDGAGRRGAIQRDRN
jgi:hypothetical protein